MIETKANLITAKKKSTINSQLIISFLPEILAEK
jgi:hypothetical protein